MPNETTDHAAMTRAAEHALAWLDGLENRPVATTATLDEMRRRLGRPLTDRGVEAVQVIDDLVADVAGGILGSQSGRFFAWVIGGGVPSAMAADWLTTVWDQNAGIHACGPAASVVEEVTAGWLKDLFGLPTEASVGFVTGTQMAHSTCLAAARHAVLRDRGWDVERQGLVGSPAIRILANAERHGSVDRAVRLMGLGSDNIVPLATDDGGCVSPDALGAALRASSQPTIVVLQAGELNRAGFDPFEALAPMARAAGAWTHVDGAFGLWARATATHRDLARGIEHCDSWTTDAHKYLNVPYDSGLAIIRDAAAHRAAMTLSTSYLPAGGAARDQIDWNPEFSRRARGFPIYAALRELGRDGVADLVDRTCRFAQALVAGIGALPGAKVVATSSLNQGLVRFLSPAPGASEADHDARTDEVIAAIDASGEAYFGGVTFGGRRCMRISVCNWRTTEADVARTVAAVAGVLRG
ncbi:pyridoxal-dependent decarboxylase [Phenylobacterium sp.]|uniref:pyridoxal phosphate-dependent decarboxylase family protein n=1 Tax=Phenylobacterium sp. TaxID=1871053 RepID=UPI001225F514|nr:pyridoxal-dependent decarboxylase [Phenylobacterium sp.]THD52690.1 MAG: aspartate aminotransferase family protein [Phenylobacterium sp.]